MLYSKEKAIRMYRNNYRMQEDLEDLPSCVSPSRNHWPEHFKYMRTYYV